jgi:hypothetical protein
VAEAIDAHERRPGDGQQHGGAHRARRDAAAREAATALPAQRAQRDAPGQERRRQHVGVRAAHVVLERTEAEDPGVDQQRRTATPVHAGPHRAERRDAEARYRRRGARREDQRVQLEQVAHREHEEPGRRELTLEVHELARVRQRAGAHEREQRERREDRNGAGGQLGDEDTGPGQDGTCVLVEHERREHRAAGREQTELDVE